MTSLNYYLDQIEENSFNEFQKLLEELDNIGGKDEG